MYNQKRQQTIYNVHSIELDVFLLSCCKSSLIPNICPQEGKKWQNKFHFCYSKILYIYTYITFKFSLMAWMIYFSEMYQKAMYLQGKRQNEHSPFLDDFWKIVTVFNWSEEEPKSNVGSFYIRPATRISTSMEVSKSAWERRFMSLIMKSSYFIIFICTLGTIRKI